ncbi:MAG TPA: cupin domain-containing protein [Candidatus Marinimicrobia bacterium]|nr:cupin domain-containing protein [Candidatus Neomarinimicrobiota bacterium]HRS51209.1 cupin domain-containing protein [Candidatus Neomarinimicrobiota bacterium]HRU91553.1 cupin domain-containing protein [Candidatus Neomarinimicrobiota bacterium]
MDQFSDEMWIDPKPSVELFQISGNWSNDRGTCGVFRLEPSEQAYNYGDLTDYDRNTVFDNHFHDCDEYWFIVKGQGIAVSERKSYTVQAGDCVITVAGEHHDFPIVHEPILAVWFEGSLKGKKRPGHLYCEK